MRRYFSFLLWSFVFSVVGHMAKACPNTSEDTLCIQTASKKISFSVEVPATPQEFQKGLMFRKKLAPNHGMLFLFPAGSIPTMWMKNTYVSLDMLFIDDTGKVVFIAKNTKPLSEARIAPPTEIGRPVRAVLELKAGTTDSYQIQVGDVVDHAAFFLAPPRH